LLTADQLPSEPFVMRESHCKTMFNNELWTVTNRCLRISIMSTAIFVG
jgi:hypothetical protein